MLATFVIGLREGLEAALIVVIIAAFLRANGYGLKAMWVGVAAAVALSLAVGLSLAALEKALPQAAQEGLETVIGLVAIVFVTGMIFWMNAHARGMKRRLEADAARALGQSSVLALASMAFLAVLKEGFETSVFLLATFSAAQSASVAAIGAVLGLAVAAVIGWAIFAGGLQLNLSRFFKVTGAFLILVAAGLVVSCLRTAHEAGWLNAGQTVAADLSWLVEPGTVRAALLTGVLGIPADPRLIEVLGWLSYLLPVAALVYWPRTLRPAPRTAARLRLAAAACLALLAAGLAILLPKPFGQLPEQAALEAGSGENARIVGALALTTGPGGLPNAIEVDRPGAAPDRFALADARAYHDQHDGLSSTAYEWPLDGAGGDAPARLTLRQVMELGGGRLPRGLNPGQHPGPFDADWTFERQLIVWTASGRLLDAEVSEKAVVSLTSEDLSTPRTIRIADMSALSLPSAWHASEDYRQAARASLSTAVVDLAEYDFWARQFPVILGLLALVLTATGARALRTRPDDPPGTRSVPPFAAHPKEASHAAE